MPYNKERYIKYKKKQELLGRKRVNLVLDKNIAQTLKEYMKKPLRLKFEHQMKSYFLKEPFVNDLKSDRIEKVNNIMPHINILVSELQREVQEMNKTMVILKKKIETLMSQDHPVDSRYLKPTDNSPQKLNLNKD